MEQNPSTEGASRSLAEDDETTGERRGFEPRMLLVTVLLIVAAVVLGVIVQ